MSKANEALARRWMASKHWGGWRVGMVEGSTGEVCVGVSEETGEPMWTVERDYPRGVDVTRNYEPGHPDLDHPGTLAFLLGDVRRAHGITWAQVATLMTSGGVHGYRVTGTGADAGDTEAAALIAALDAAP